MSMHISYRQLLAFVHVAQSASFADAAAKMYLSQPALSLAIKKMEQQLGGPLFSRSTRKVSLSPEGVEFLPVATRLLADWDHAIEDMQNLFALRRGKLNIAAMPSFAASLLPGFIESFHHQWPNIAISVTDVVMESVIHMVRAGQTELGFTFESEAMEGLDFRALFTDTFIAVVPQNSVLASQPQINWQDLQTVPFVAMNRGSAIRRWLDDAMMSQNATLDITAEASQLATLGQFIRHGLGVSVVPGICREQMHSRGVVCKTIAGAPLVKQVGIVRASNRVLSKSAQALWDLVTA